MRARFLLALAILAASARGAAAQSEEPSDADFLELAESDETIVIWDERPEKPFDRDTEVRLTGEELAARGATDLATALQLLPDVSVRDAGRGGFNIDIRGARKGAVRVLIDGVAVSDPFYGTFDVSTIPVTDIVEIRVSTAPASPIDGPGGPGGVIEVHTRDAIGTQLVVARATADSLPRFGASATGRVPMGKHLALRLSASSLFGFEQFGLPDDSTMTDKRRATTGAMRLEHRDGGRRIAVDGFVDDRRYVSPPSDELATALILLIDRETTGRAAIAIDDDLGADKKLQFQARTWVHAMKRLSRNFRDPALTDQANSEALFSMRAGGTALLTRPIGRLARWAAAVTVDHERASVDTTVINGNNVTRTPTRGDATVIEAAGDAQLEKGRWKLDGSAGIAVPAGIDADPWPEAKLTALYTHRYGSIEAIGARKGRVPSLRERFQGTGANITLDPEQAWHAETRVTARPRDGIEITAAPYYRRTTGTVKVDMTTNMLVNLGELVVTGIDLSAKAQLNSRVGVGAAYDYAKASSDDLGPDPLDRFPAHRAEGWLQVRPIARLALLTRARYVGRAIDRGDITPAYVLWDLTATVTVGREWIAAIRCDDLFDVAPETRSGYRQPGRVFSLVVQRSWE